MVTLSEGDNHCLFEGGGIVSLWRNFGWGSEICDQVLQRGGESILPQNCVTSFMDVPYRLINWWLHSVLGQIICQKFRSRRHISETY